MNRDVIELSTQLVIDTFKGFHDELLASFGNIAFERKSDYSPVTVLDVKIEKSLKSKLAKAFPEIGFKGEETGYQEGSQHFWLVDPIDGTKPFVRGWPYATCMAVLISDGQAVASVIYDFYNNKLFTAVKGEGAFCNGLPIHVSDR